MEAGSRALWRCRWHPADKHFLPSSPSFFTLQKAAGGEGSPLLDRGDARCCCCCGDGEALKAAEARWDHPGAGVPAVPAGMASVSPAVPSLCSVKSRLAFHSPDPGQIQRGFSRCAGVPWLLVTFLFTTQLPGRFVGDNSSRYPRSERFQSVHFRGRLNCCELLGWESSSCSHLEELCAAGWGQAVPSILTVCPGAVGVPKGSAPVPYQGPFHPWFTLSQLIIILEAAASTPPAVGRRPRPQLLMPGPCAEPAPGVWRWQCHPGVPCGDQDHAEVTEH